MNLLITGGESPTLTCGRARVASAAVHRRRVVEI
jgi:hypothetical protein